MFLRVRKRELYHTIPIVIVICSCADKRMQSGRRFHIAASFCAGGAGLFAQCEIRLPSQQSYYTITGRTVSSIPRQLNLQLLCHSLSQLMVAILAFIYRGWAKEWTLGFMNLLSWRQRESGMGFPQPKAISFAQPCTLWIRRIEHRIQSRGLIGLHQLGQTNAPSILFPVLNPPHSQGRVQYKPLVLF